MLCSSSAADNQRASPRKGTVRRASLVLNCSHLDSPALFVVATNWCASTCRALTLQVVCTLFQYGMPLTFAMHGNSFGKEIGLLVHECGSLVVECLWCWRRRCCRQAPGAYDVGHGKANILREVFDDCSYVGHRLSLRDWASIREVNETVFAENFLETGSTGCLESCEKVAYSIWSTDPATPALHRSTL